MSVKKMPTGRWRATAYVGGRQYTRHFGTKREAEEWEIRERESVQRGAWIDPDKRRITVAEWSERWLIGYEVNRSSTVRQARVHLKRINATFGTMRLADVTPSHVKAWVASMLKEGLADSTAYAHHRRLSQLYIDAQHEGLVSRNPTSRRTSPKAGRQRPYVATAEQVWALYDAMPVGLRPAILLGAFAGLRVGEAVALTTADVDFMRGLVTVRATFSDGDFGAPVKTEASAATVPMPVAMMSDLGEAVRHYDTEHLVVSAHGGPITPTRVDVHFRRARATVAGLPDGFRFHDLRHFYASTLIAAGHDIKKVQARMRHASAKVTLDVYGHLMPGSDDATRDAIAAVMRPASGQPGGAADVVSLDAARARRGA